MNSNVINLVPPPTPIPFSETLTQLTDKANTLSELMGGCHHALLIIADNDGSVGFVATDLELYETLGILELAKLAIIAPSEE